MGSATASRVSQPNVNPWIVAVAVMLGTFMEVLDTTVVNVSLPHIAGDLSASFDEATWVLTSYLVANAIVLPITGWLSSQFGRKNLLMLSVVGFTASSVLCGISPSLPLLIFFRLIQGATGGCLQPLSQSVLLEAFPPEERGKAMGFWGLGIVAAPVLGPVLGGWLTDNYSWRWVFYINLPVGVAAIMMTRLFVFDPPYLRRARLGVDYWGIGLLAVWVGALQIVLDKGQEEDWFSSHLILGLTITFGVFLILFLAWELLVNHPVVDLRVFRIPTFSTGVFLMTIVGFVLYGSLVLLPLWLQTLLGYPPLQAGIALAPRGMGSMVGMPIVGAIIGRVDPRKLLATGLVGGAGTLYAFSRLNLNAGYWDFFWPQFLQGMCLALLFVPLTTISMGPVPKPEIGNATSLFNLMRNIGGSVGIALVTTMNARWQQKYTNLLGANVTPTDPQTRDLVTTLGGDQRAHAMLFGMVQRQAAMLSVVQVFELLAVLFLILVPFLLLMKRPPKGEAVAAH